VLVIDFLYRSIHLYHCLIYIYIYIYIGPIYTSLFTIYGSTAEKNIIKIILMLAFSVFLLFTRNK